MQSSTSRHASPKSDHIDRDFRAGPVTASHINNDSLQQTYYESNPCYPANAEDYVHESGYDRIREVPSQQNIRTELGRGSYNHVADLAGPELQPSQPHLPPKSNVFPKPASRGIYDSSGQACPPGGRPKLSSTLWEDEGTLCYQVEAHQVTVARREDNNYINGTKLLNVASMSRGKRDGILKNEAKREVIKVGSMHLKGVWIPFDRALELANKYFVTDHLYPLFVRDIKNFLYHPANYARTTAVMLAAEQRKGKEIMGIDASLDERPPLDRSLSMPTPLDRSLFMLTPPSSASTNGDYWANNVHQTVPLTDTHARAHSLPGTPATTPPAPSYFKAQNTQQHVYMGAFSEPRPQSSSNLYGQQADMQRSYQHSRTTSLMSYQDEDMSNASSSHSMLQNHYTPVLAQQPPTGEQSRYQNQTYQYSHDRVPLSTRQEVNQAAAVMPEVMSHDTNMRLGLGTPKHERTHSRSHSRGSLKMFNTPNLTTQMSRRVMRTPNASPQRTHARQASRELQAQSNQASLWVQQQQQLTYNTPQQAARGHMRQLSNQAQQLPQIYEETPSCRMAYQLLGQSRMNESFATNINGAEGQVYRSAAVHSPDRGKPLSRETGNSPLTGKKRRERVTTDIDTSHVQPHSTLDYSDRQESLTPPPIVEQQQVEYDESSKRRRTGMHSRVGSYY